MSTRIATRYSTRELQAAADALTAGQFSCPVAPAPALATSTVKGIDTVLVRDHAGSEPVVDSECSGDTAEALSTSKRRPGAGLTVSAGSAPLVRVRPTNAGAGASTVALALADVADDAGARTRVLDAAAPAWSGLSGATATELGAVAGWRRGRRGHAIVIDRVEEPIRLPTDVPTPRSIDGIDLTVLDVGWSIRELAADAEPGWVCATPADAEVLVTRPHSLALSQTEAVLAHLEQQLAADQVVVVVVGARHFNDREITAAGRRLRTCHDQGAVLFAPLLSAKTLPGLGPDRLPKQLTKSSQRLLQRITTITGPLTASRT